MNLFLHVCCGPCTIFPLSVLREKGTQVTGYFFNPNIHPYKEFERRLLTLQSYADDVQLPLIVEKQYGLSDFVRKIAFHEEERCNICYLMRLEKTAAMAKERGFDAFSTTLLYSKYQRHSQLIKFCEQLSSQYQVPFYYHDFRDGWQLGIKKSKELDMYRQPYCGCIYSEQERFDKSLRKK